MSLSVFGQHFLFLATLAHYNDLVRGEKKHRAHIKCSKLQKKYLEEREIEKSETKFSSIVYNILSASQVKIIAIASLIKSNTDSDMHA